MTDARLERIAPDPWAGAAFLERADQFATDGARRELSAESRQVLLHGAVIAACDALLAVRGYEVVGSDGGHVLRLSRVAELLPGAQIELFERLDEARVSRNEASYAAAPVPAADIESAAVDVRELIDLVDREVKPAPPEWQWPSEHDP